MSRETYLQAILDEKVIIRPKRSFTHEEVVDIHGQAPSESEDAWRLPCTHTVNPPATPSALALVEHEIEQELPDSLRDLLLLANGLKLYIAPLAGGGEYVEYHIFSTEELAYWKREMYNVFRATYKDDPELCDIRILNYVAFCDAHDGNYLAIVSEGARTGQIFFLNHELCFRPYSEQDSDFYFIVAESIEAWLETIWRTKGLGGFGRKYLTYFLTGEFPERD